MSADVPTDPAAGVEGSGGGGQEQEQSRLAGKSLHDARMEGMALRRGWILDPDKVKAIVDDQVGVILPGEGKKYRVRHRLMASRNLMQADLRQQQIDLDRERLLMKPREAVLADHVGAAEERAEQRLAERANARE